MLIIVSEEVSAVLNLYVGPDGLIEGDGQNYQLGPSDVTHVLVGILKTPVGFDFVAFKMPTPGYFLLLSKDGIDELEEKELNRRIKKSTHVDLSSFFEFVEVA